MMGRNLMAMLCTHPCCPVSTLLDTVRSGTHNQMTCQPPCVVEALPQEADGCLVWPSMGQLIRAAIAQQTGVDPPAPLPPPRMHDYGSVELCESASLLSQIRHLYPGEGITSEAPMIMEEYGQA